MTSIVKRRNTPRRRPQKLGVTGDGSAGPTWLNEAIAILFFGIAVFLTLSIASFALNDPAEVARRQNLLGPSGHFFGTLLSGLFGWSSVLPLSYLFWLSRHFWVNELSPSSSPLPKLTLQLFARMLGFLAVMVSAAGLFASTSGVVGGGRVGQAIARPLLNNFNAFGSVLFCVAFLLISIALSSGQSVQQVIFSCTRAVGDIFALIFSVLPGALMATLRWIGGGLGWFISCVIGANLWAKLCGLFAKAPTEEMPIPKPRVRKNTIKSEEDKERDSSDLDSKNASEEVDDDYSHVVVMRRENPKSAAPRKKVKAQPVEPEDKDLSEAFPSYESPDINLLTKGDVSVGGEDDEELRQKSRQIEVKLRDFGVFGRVTQVHPGPVITLFEFEPAAGVKVGRIAALQDDLAMSLKASSIRIIAPIPKRGTVGIEVPNKTRDMVRLRDVLENEAFTGAESTLTVALGKDTYGDPVVVDIALMPHLLMAGTTGTGKSVCINSLLLSLLYRCHPSELGLILIDPKILELSTYEDIPHLRVPVVTVPKQARAVLDWAAQEMDRRYRLMQRFGVRNIDGFNRIARGEDSPDGMELKKENEVIELAEDAVVASGTVDAPSSDETKGDIPIGEKLQPLPKIVIVIDELADLMLTVGRDIEELITRLAQKARASGIHLIVATQRPSVDVITGLIKANFPSRISFRVATRVDSRTILDSMGAEKLLGRGDALFMSPGAEGLRRIHGAFVSDSEVKRVVEALKKKAKPCYDERIIQICQKALEEGTTQGPDGEPIEGEHDAMYDRAVELVLEKGQASTSMIQRVFRIGYNRAARIIETMEREGLIGPMDGAKPREVLVQNNRETEL